MDPELVQISKFMSLVLRHRPELAGLKLDDQGWVEVDALIAGANRKGVRLNQALLERVVLENDKSRFSLSTDGKRIRANQGHSVHVDLGLAPKTPPQVLYHGTGSQSVQSILKSGLLKGQRHAVHLSLDVETARKVGARHGRPVILQIDSARMSADGWVFTCSDNGVWLAETVPPHYIRVLEDERPGE